MDQKLSYEQLITTRLEALPIPDMADAIWNRIEQQLDLDMPTGDGGGGSVPGKPPGGLIAGGISLLFVIAFISFLLFNGNKQQNLVPSSEPSIPGTTTAPLSKPPDLPVPGGGEAVDNTRKNDVNLPPSQNDLVDLTPVPSDSPQVINIQSPAPVITQPSPLGIDTPAQVKKGRGVTGISDSDYRIIPKKDSSR